uniref:MIR domain-containing protein n=2 Tax=Corethron hystrix TaxID=216773 RepID=A0A7S1BUQ8_9STRA|mmetsp:Transcript_39622/g.92708  ORF Transcript_39622/g.92708 Transcript_39622/m.92708 type:complete len:217 (+) Transcript_39622:1124-1774(+)
MSISYDLPLPPKLLQFVGISLVLKNNPLDMPLTFGSAIRVSHAASGGYELETGAINFGSGSGQQAVTFTPRGEGALWLIKGPYGEPTISSGSAPVECGAQIRLEHLSSKKNLHTHNFRSPLTGNQEVSAYGEDGEGDANDNWYVLCDGKYWVKGAHFTLKNVVTKQYLQASKDNNFNQRNGCGNGCPVAGHLEASASKVKGSGTVLKAEVGVFLSK